MICSCVNCDFLPIPSYGPSLEDSRFRWSSFRGGRSGGRAHGQNAAGFERKERAVSAKDKSRASRAGGRILTFSELVPTGRSYSSTSSKARLPAGFMASTRKLRGMPGMTRGTTGQAQRPASAATVPRS